MLTWVGTCRLLPKHGFVTNLHKSVHLGSLLSTVIGTPTIGQQSANLAFPTHLAV